MITRCSRRSPATPASTRTRSRCCGALCAQRHPRRAQPGAQDGQQRCHGRRHPASRGGGENSSTTPVSRIGQPRFRPLSGPHLLQRHHLRGLCPGRRTAHRLRRALRRPAGALRMGHPWGGLRHRREPVARGARGGRRRAPRSSGLHRLRRRPRRTGAGHGAAPRRLGGRRASRRRARAAAPAPAPQRRRLRLELADGREASGSWRDVLHALGIA